MKTYPLLICLTIASFIFLSWQQHQKSKEEADAIFDRATQLFQTNLDSCVEYSNQALSLYNGLEDWGGVISCCNNLMSSYRMKKDLTRTQEYLDKAWSIFNEHKDLKDTATIVTLMNNMAVNYNDRFEYDKAIEMLKLSLSYQSDDPGLTATVFSNMGWAFSRKGDFAESEQYMKTSLEIKQKEGLGKDLMTAYMDLTNLSIRKKDYILAKDYCLKAIESLQYLEGELKNKGNIRCYDKLTDVLLRLEDVGAFTSFAKTKALYIDLKKPFNAKFYSQSAKIALMKSDTNKALNDLKMCVDLAKSEYTKIPLGLTYNSVSKELLKMALIPMALASNDTALSLMSGKDLNWETIPPQDFISPIDAVTCLKTRAEILEENLAKTPDNLKLLEKIHLLYTKISEISTYITQEYYEDNSKLYYSAEINKIYQSALKTAKALYQKTGEDKYLESAFYFAEQAKGTALQQARKMKSKQLDVFSKTENKTYQDLKSQIAYYRKEINLEKQNNEPQIEEIKKWEGKIFDLKQKVQPLEDKLKSKSKGEHIANTMMIEGIQKGLKQHQALLEYHFTSDSSLVVFAISKQQKQMFDLKCDSTISKLKYISALSVPPLTGDMQHTFDEMMKHGLATYQQVFAPIETFLQKENVKRLVIVPEGGLCRLPFEALITTNPKHAKIDYSTKNISYLVSKYSFSYLPSYSSMAENIDKSSNGSISFLGIAPAFSNGLFASVRDCNAGESLSALQNNISEVEEINEQMKGKKLSKTDATKANFLKEAPSSRIIHLATHACADDQNPALNKIFFSNEEYLTQQELEAMNLNADLAVLSACQTGIGKEAKGEGVMSLSRGFLYAGCQSALMSLWSVNDKATAGLMPEFYTNMSAGMHKDEAIQQAKLTWLNEKADASTQHPMYWAGFVLYGSAEELDSNGIPFTYWIIGAILVVLLGVWFYRRKIKA